MERQPQNPEFRDNPENFHLCYVVLFFCLWFYVPVNSYGHAETVTLFPGQA